jgi:outer membrane protein OmpA-like peptidoglycan-associated protein
MHNQLTFTIYRPSVKCLAIFHHSPLIWSVCLSFLIVGLATTYAHADWQYQVTDHVKPGQKAKLDFRPPRSIKQVKIVLRSGNKIIHKKVRKANSNKTTSIRFKVPYGSSKWQVDITGKAAQENLEVRFEFTIVSVGALKINFLEESSSLEDGLLTFKANRKLHQAELKAYGDEGEMLWEDQVLFQEEGKIQKVIFSNREEVPRRLEVKVIDPHGSWLSIRIVRWYAEVPHEDVLFNSGSADIQKSEIPKMQEAIKAVQAELTKFKTAMGDPNARVDLQLYVGGYTDTVGDNRDNLKLSRQRAQAIARYFKQKGIVIPILYAGFGEKGLLVQTADHIDEARNRRAIYIVANHQPSGFSFPHAQWRNIGK